MGRPNEIAQLEDQVFSEKQKLLRDAITSDGSSYTSYGGYTFGGDGIQKIDAVVPRFRYFRAIHRIVDKVLKKKNMSDLKDVFEDDQKKKKKAREAKKLRVKLAIQAEDK